MRTDVDREQQKSVWQKLPLEIFPEGGDPLSPQRQAQWIWALLAIGILARLVRYLLRFPLWEDEAMLATNFFDRGYLGLLQPLNYCQVGAPLFLWGQLTVVKVLGFTEYSLRLIPFACSMAAVLLYYHLAARLLKGTTLVLAVGLFAVGYPGIRYASEAKPYGCDLLFALLMLVLLVRWLQQPQQTRWLWALTGVVGVAVGYSYPAVFVGGAISLVVAWVLWSGSRRGLRQDQASGLRRTHASGWLAWIAYNAVLVGSFAVLLLISRIFVGDAVQQRMVDEHWWHAFPPLMQPLQLVVWLISTHAGSLLAYPVGGPNGGSTLSFILFVLGAVVLFRRRQTLLLAILLVPLLLNFVAAAMHRYPYGGHVKLGLYDAAAFCMLPAVGLAALLAWHARRRPHARGPLFCVLATLMLLALASLTRDLTYPYKSGTTLRARDFARWFWFDLTHDGELVCLETDLKQNLSPGTYEWGWSALYLCNQRIYSPRHARGEPPRLDRVSAAWPLRCVLFRSATEERNGQALERWLGTMKTQYELVAHDKYPFAIYDKWDSGRRGMDFIEVFKFVPHNANAAAATGLPPSGSTRR